MSVKLHIIGIIQIVEKYNIILSCCVIVWHGTSVSILCIIYQINERGSIECTQKDTHYIMWSYEK